MSPINIRERVRKQSLTWTVKWIDFEEQSKSIVSIPFRVKVSNSREKMVPIIGFGTPSIDSGVPGGLLIMKIVV
jgi:hypothetical protein